MPSTGKQVVPRVTNALFAPSHERCAVCDSSRPTALTSEDSLHVGDQQRLRHGPPSVMDACLIVDSRDFTGNANPLDYYRGYQPSASSGC